MYAIKDKKNCCISVRKVMDLAIAKFVVSPTARGIQRYVKDGIIGQSPLKNVMQVTYLHFFLTCCVHLMKAL